MSRAQEALAKLESPDIFNGPAEVLRQLPPEVVAQAILLRLDEEPGVQTAALTPQELFWIGTLGKFGGKPASARHVDLLARALSDRVAWRNALAGLGQLDAGSPLHERAVEKAFESLLVVVEKAASAPDGADVAQPQLAPLLRYLDREAPHARGKVEDLARTLVASGGLDERSRSQAVAVLIESDDLRALQTECSELGLESAFWSQVGRRLHGRKPCEVAGTWLRWCREAGIHETYSAWLAGRFESRRASPSDLMVLASLVVVSDRLTDCEDSESEAAIHQSFPGFVRSEQLAVLLETGLADHMTGSNRDIDWARTVLRGAVDRVASGPVGR